MFQWPIEIGDEWMQKKAAEAPFIAQSLKLWHLFQIGN
jgi:hypothetical protein